MSTQPVRIFVTFLFMLLPLTVTAQSQRDPVPTQNWPAPLYWQPSSAEEQANRAKPEMFGRLAAISASDVGAQAQTPANSLVFVGMTPCRVVDTRNGSGFSGPFGPPSLAAGISRTLPMQFSTTCSIPSIAQAYSVNVTVVPPGFLDYLTMWPTGQPQPFVSTVNSYLGTVAANAAIVPAGINGSIDVYASQNTNLIIDINGYYAQPSGLTLGQGSAGAPSLSFAGDAGTGMFSSSSGTVDIAAGGANRLSVHSNGITDVNGKLNILGQDGIEITGFQPFLTLRDTNAGGARGRIASGGGDLSFYPESSFQTGIPAMTVRKDGSVGIGTTSVAGYSNSGPGVYAQSESLPGVWSESQSGPGLLATSVSGVGVSASNFSGRPAVEGSSSVGPGVLGESHSNAGVAGSSSNGPGLVARSVTNNLVEGYPSLNGSVRTFHITNNGTYVAGSDFAEALPAEGDKASYEPGDVLVLSTSVLGRVERTSRTYDERVAGVYSTRPGMLGAEKDGATRVDADDLPVAIIGVVPTKVSAESGPIQLGDLLTTSSTPGYAMRCEDRLKCFGATLGKAMEPLAEGKGLIKVLVTLR